MTNEIKPIQIDALLPQTQCGLCGYGGCMPYANAIALKNEELNLCPPGGVKTLKSLGTLLKKDITALIPEMETKAKPNMFAKIKEHECIGCTKCIKVCPVDAIIGGAKQMHSVIQKDCTGCELCIPACPVDCIEMINLPPLKDSETKHKSDYFRNKFNKRQKRLLMENETIQKQKINLSVPNKKNYIADALLRMKDQNKETKY